MPPIRPVLFTTLGTLLLASCAGITPVTEASRQTPTSGGSAGQMGPGYCHHLPDDPTRQSQWLSLCFSRN